MTTAAHAPAPAGRREIFLAAAVTLLVLLPFAGKAFHIDDTLFLKAARQIRVHPLDFYGFSANWFGTELSMWQVMKNPPLAAYFIALVTAIAGETETALHLAFLLPAVAAILGTYVLARRLCSYPLLAAMATLFCPAFLVSSTNVMCDTLLLAFWVWAVELWLRGIGGDGFRELTGSVLLMSLAALTKYFGMALLPLLFAHGIVRTRRIGTWALSLILPVLVLTGYQTWTRSLYGQGLLADAATYAILFRFHSGVLVFTKALVGLCFAGGCFASAAFFAPWLWSRRALVAAAVAALVAGGIAAAARLVAQWGGNAQVGVFAIAGANVLALTWADYRRRRDASSVLLLLWVAGTFTFAVFLNWTVNARTFLPAAPAVAIILARRLELHPSLSRATTVIPLAAAAVLSFAAAWADFGLAGAAREAAPRIVAEAGGDGSGTLWFEGHWGFQRYMEQAGAKPLDFRRSRVLPGDRIAVPLNNTNLLPLPAESFAPRSVVGVPVLPFLSTLSPAVGAGFYTDIWGPLPFAFGAVPPERYAVVEVLREIPPGEIAR